MASKRRRDLNLILKIMCYDEEDDSHSDSEDLEMLLLSTFTREKDLSLYFHVCLDNLSEDECENMFRFQKADIIRLGNALSLPEYYHCYQRTVCSGQEALLILLRRLAYPNRWCDLVTLFGRSEPVLSMIFNKILNDIYDRFRHLLENLALAWLDPETFSQAIYSKGAPLACCWGFIDGTVRRICRPIRSQRIMYSGHKRVHCIKFQSVVTPNGLIANLFGPIEGRRHDAFMLTESRLLEQLQERMNMPNGDAYVLYGDPAYPICKHMIAPFRAAHLTEAEKQFNKDMSAVRVCVEWSFGKIVQYFAFVDFSKNLKVLLQPVGKLYIVAALLTNCHTCLYGSQTGDYFGLNAPQLEAYLNNH